MSMSYWIVLLLVSPVYCACWALNWDKLCPVETTAWWLIVILSMFICGPGDDLFLCVARASAGPMMTTNCFQSLCGGPCQCYTMLPDWSHNICECFTLISVTCLCIDIPTVFLDAILYFIEVYFDIIILVTSLFVSDCLYIFFFQSDPSLCYTFLRVIVYWCQSFAHHWPR